MAHLTELAGIEQQLGSASHLDEVWSEVLTLAVRFLRAEDGAWIWSAPQAQVLRYGGNGSNDFGDFNLALTKAAFPIEPKGLTLTPRPDPVSRTAPQTAPQTAQHFLFLPITVDPWAGWLVLRRSQGPFEATDWDAGLFISEMARLTATSLIRQDRINQARAQRVRELETLHYLGRTINESLELQDTLDEVLQALNTLVPYDEGEITLYDSQRDLLVRRAYRASEVLSHRPDSVDAVYGTDEGLSGWLVRHHSSLLIADLASDGMIYPAGHTLAARARSYLGIPLMARNQLVGTLEIVAAEPARFSSHHRELTELFAAQAASAIENARLYTRTDAELRRRFAALEALQRVTREITSTIDLDRILNVVLEEGIRNAEADAGFVIMLEDSRRIRASRGYTATELTAAEAAVANPESHLSRWLQFEQTTSETDIHWKGDRESDDNECGLLGAQSFVMVPVFYEQRMAAAILLQSRRVSAFGPAAVEFLEGLAGQTALAVGNAQRYQEQLRRGELMHRRAEQMSLLLEISRTVRSDRSLGDILSDVSYAVQEGTRFDVVLISVLEGNYLRRVAGAGMPLVELEKRKEFRLPWERVRRLCQEQFRMGQCYYIPEQHRALTNDLDVFVHELPVASDKPNRWHLEDFFFVVLKDSGGNTIGIMSVDMPQDGLAPTALTAEVVEVFAAQVSQAIENHRLVEDLRRQVSTLQLFNELSRSIATKLDLPLVLNTVVQSVTNLLGYDYSTIFLAENSGDQFTPMASSGYTLDYVTDFPVSKSMGFIGDVVRTAMPLVVENAPEDKRYAGWRVPVGSAVAVPLGVEGRTVGVLTADRKEPGDFSPAEVATLTALADQVAVAVDNVRLFEEVKRFNEELERHVADRTQELGEALERLRFQRDRSEILYRIASELVASLDMDRVLSQALILLQRAVRASRSAVILLDHNTGQLLYRAAIGHTQPIPPGGEVVPSGRREGLVGSVLQTREPLIIPDVLKEGRLALECDETTRSVMAVPILGGGGESVGVILLQSPVVDVFDETQLRLVEAAAVQLGNALNNAELYRLIREQAERLGTMLRVQQIDAAKTEAILEGIADGVMVADASGRIILFNVAAERILSIAREQALGRSQDEIFGLYGCETHEWMTQVAVWRDKPQHHGTETYLAHRLEVGRRFVSIHLSPVVSETREFLGVVSVFRDITVEIEADRAKSDFVSTVSHELRTPMTSIVGYVDLMIHGAVGQLPPMQAEFLKKVKTNADRLTNLVNDLLDISRIEQGRIELLCRPQSVEALISQIMDLVQPKIKEKNQTLATVLPSQLPQVFCDPDRLAQILTNLVSNAYKYTPIGGDITIYAYVRAGMMHIAIADTGIGIAPENQKRIFERFSRVEDDPAVYEVSGTGLGLAISLSLIQMHGGSIWLESELGEGSIFTFSLPLAAGEPTADVGDLPPCTFSVSAPTILVVDADAEFGQLLRVALEAEGMKVLTVSSGEAALRLARQKLPDFISLEMRLPDLDGLEVLQLLKRDPETADIPVAIVSVLADRERGMALGALDYLTKPLSAPQVVRVVQRTLQRHETVVAVGGDREALGRLRSSLQQAGIAVRTTLRSEQALRFARDLQPAALVLVLGTSDIDGGEFLDRLRRDARTADIPVVVISALAGGTGMDGGQVREKLQGFGGVHFVSETQELMMGISAFFGADTVEKES